MVLTKPQNLENSRRWLRRHDMVSSQSPDRHKQRYSKSRRLVTPCQLFLGADGSLLPTVKHHGKVFMPLVIPMTCQKAGLQILFPGTPFLKSPFFKYDFSAKAQLQRAASVCSKLHTLWFLGSLDLEELPLSPSHVLQTRCPSAFASPARMSSLS